jgi:archaemetzincin
MDAAVLDAVSGALAEVFGCTCRRPEENTGLPPWTYMPRRRQYNSTDLLPFLAKLAGPGEHVLGLTEADLCMSIFTFVFGEAQLPGTAAVVSTHRMHEAFYGLQENPALLAERACKESVHEVGHNIGLVHCRNASCVMYPSDGVEDTDVKNAFLCPACRAAWIEIAPGRS